MTSMENRRGVGDYSLEHRRGRGRIPERVGWVCRVGGIVRLLRLSIRGDVVSASFLLSVLTAPSYISLSNQSGPTVQTLRTTNRQVSRDIHRSHRMGRLYRFPLSSTQSHTTSSEHHVIRDPRHPSQTHHRQTSRPRPQPCSPQRRPPTIPRSLPRHLHTTRSRRSRCGPTDLVCRVLAVLPIRRGSR